MCAFCARHANTPRWFARFCWKIQNIIQSLLSRAKGTRTPSSRSAWNGKHSTLINLRLPLILCDSFESEIETTLSCEKCFVNASKFIWMTGAAEQFSGISVKRVCFCRIFRLMSSMQCTEYIVLIIRNRFALPTRARYSCMCIVWRTCSETETCRRTSAYQMHSNLVRVQIHSHTTRWYHSGVIFKNVEFQDIILISCGS